MTHSIEVFIPFQEWLLAFKDSIKLRKLFFVKFCKAFFEYNEMKRIHYPICLKRSRSNLALFLYFCVSVGEFTILWWKLIVWNKFFGKKVGKACFLVCLFQCENVCENQGISVDLNCITFSSVCRVFLPVPTFS